jgi:hypothetical protein
MGTTISPGPWKIDCGSGVRLGAGEDVGEGVSEGWRVAVSVGKGVGEIVRVADAVAEGSGLKVPVGTNVGVGWAMNLIPPQAMMKTDNAEMPRKGLLIVAGLPGPLNAPCVKRMNAAYNG